MKDKCNQLRITFLSFLCIATFSASFLQGAGGSENIETVFCKGSREVVSKALRFTVSHKRWHLLFESVGALAFIIAPPFIAKEIWEMYFEDSEGEREESQYIVEKIALAVACIGVMALGSWWLHSIKKRYYALGQGLEITYDSIKNLDQTMKWEDVESVNRVSTFTTTYWNGWEQGTRLTDRSIILKSYQGDVMTIKPHAINGDYLTILDLIGNLFKYSESGKND